MPAQLLVNSARQGLRIYRKDGPALDNGPLKEGTANQGVAAKLESLTSAWSPNMKDWQRVGIQTDSKYKVVILRKASFSQQYRQPPDFQKPPQLQKHPSACHRRLSRQQH